MTDEQFDALMDELADQGVPASERESRALRIIREQTEGTPEYEWRQREERRKERAKKAVQSLVATIERKVRIKRKPKSIFQDSTPITTAKAMHQNKPHYTFSELVAQQVRNGMSRRQAAQHVAKHHPEARQQAVEAANREKDAIEALARIEKESKTARDRFRQAVAQEERRGKSRQDAVRAVARKYPALHREYINESNL